VCLWLTGCGRINYDAIRVEPLPDAASGSGVLDETDADPGVPNGLPGDAGSISQGDVVRGDGPPQAVMMSDASWDRAGELPGQASDTLTQGADGPLMVSTDTRDASAPVEDSKADPPDSAPLGSGSFVFSVSAAVDDAQEAVNNGAVNPNNSPLNFSGNHYAGFRFTSVRIAPGSRITRAVIRVHAALSWMGPTGIRVWGEANGNPAPPADMRYNLSSRPKTAAVAGPSDWSPWTAGTFYETSDLSAVVQELVNRPDWSSGNAMFFLLTAAGGGGALITSYEGDPSLCARLTVEIQ
jgi:hypothetical protein